MVVVFVLLSTAAPQVPQTTGGNPAAKGAPQPEGRAHQTAGAGDQERQKLPAPELPLRPALFSVCHHHLLKGHIKYITIQT